MSRRYGLGLLLAACVSQAAILPEQFADYKRVSTAPVEVADRAVWDEYGLKAAERAEYQASGRKVSVTAWQLQDATGSLAAYQWLQSDGLQPDATQAGSYVLRVEGALTAPELAALKSGLPKVGRSSQPSLPGFLPAANRVKGSERYVLGPASLAKFEPRISADLAGFQKGAEAAVTQYRADGGEARFVLISYPTPQIAGERLREFEKRADMKARRHGPLVAVVLDATPQSAEKLLASVTYQPNITWSEKVPKQENPGEMILAICILAGALMVASLVLGMLFGGLRQLFGSKFGVQAIDENFTSLHLGEK